jgi:hypothetical protein
MIAPIAAFAISQPQRTVIARRRPDDMLSNDHITTDVGLVKATASPSPATSATSVPTVPVAIISPPALNVSRRPRSCVPTSLQSHSCRAADPQARSRRLEPARGSPA